MKIFLLIFILSSCGVVKNAPTIQYKLDGSKVTVPVPVPGVYILDRYGDSVYVQGRDTFEVLYGVPVVGTYCGIDSYSRKEVRRSIRHGKLDPKFRNIGVVVKRRFLFFTYYK